MEHHEKYEHECVPLNHFSIIERESQTYNLINYIYFKIFISKTKKITHYNSYDENNSIQDTKRSIRKWSYLCFLILDLGIWCEKRGGMVVLLTISLEHLRSMGHPHTHL